MTPFYTALDNTFGLPSKVHDEGDRGTAGGAGIPYAAVANGVVFLIQTHDKSPCEIHRFFPGSAVNILMRRGPLSMTVAEP